MPLELSISMNRSDLRRLDDGIEEATQQTFDVFAENLFEQYRDDAPVDSGRFQAGLGYYVDGLRMTFTNDVDYAVYVEELHYPIEVYADVGSAAIRANNDGRSIDG